MLPKKMGHLGPQTEALLTQAAYELESSVAAGLVTAWSLTLRTRTHEAVTLSAAYADEWIPNHPAPAAYGGAVAAAAAHPVFDLASLTKPLLAGLLLARGVPDASTMSELLLTKGVPETTLAHLMPEGMTLGSGMRLLDLFSHQSGLPGWRWFGRGLYNADSKSIGSLATETQRGSARCGPRMDEDRLDTFRRALVRSFLNSPNGLHLGPDAARPHVCYSDCGYYLLARFFESPYWRDRAGWQGWAAALASLNSNLGTSLAHASLTPEIAARAVPFYRYTVVESEDPEQQLAATPSFGTCQDTNANILANLQPPEPEVSTHAGLFGTSADTLRGLDALMAFVGRLRHSGSLSSLRNDRFCFCLDTPTGPTTTSGAPAEQWPETFGHLGYTGTSMWAHEPSGASWVLLTNRTSGRSMLRANPTPRLMLMSTPLGDTHGLRANGESTFAALTADDWEEERSRCTGLHAVLWNPSDIRPFADIGGLRRSLGKQYWGLMARPS